MTARTSTPEENAARSLTLAVVASSKSPLLLLDGALNVVAISASFGSVFQIDAAGAQGRQLFALGAGEWDVPQLRSLLKATAAGDADIDAYEMDLKREGREPRRLVIHAERLVYLDLSQLRLLVAVADVTDARTVVRRAEDMRRENALLLKEVRHRVANSLQIIASVLLQDARRTRSEETRSHLHSAHHRVMSVAALERQLSATDGEEIELHPYLIRLCESIAASMIHDPTLVSLDVEAEDVIIEANTLVSLGLIVTELVINALKHAFPGRRPGKIRVAYATEGDGWTMTVRDNGVGMAAEPHQPAGLGTSIVQALAKQLRAEVSIASSPSGLVVSIIHPASVAGDAAKADIAPAAI